MSDEQEPALEAETSSETQNIPVSPTEQMPSPGEPIAVEEQSASLHDVATTAGSFARNGLSQVRSFFSEHGFAIFAVALFAIVLIVGSFLVVRRLADMPDSSLFRSDAQAMLSMPQHDGGAYGVDEPLAFADFEVTSRHKDVSAPSQCRVDAIVTYSNGAVNALQEASLLYERQDGSWACISAEPVGSASYSAKSGVDPQKLHDNIGGILQRAEASRDEKTGAVALSALYADATVDILEEAFDESTQTDVATIHLSRSDTFTAYECDVKATFSFRPGNGLWELTSAEVSDGAKEATLSPLVGTWVGTFQGQIAYEGKCFGAKPYGLRVVITQAEGRRISGTLDCTAHYHAEPSSDVQEMEGDTQLEDIQFSGTLLDTASGLAFSCTTPEDANGTIEMQLFFGTESDPSSVSATLTTRHSYVTTFLFIPLEGESTFSDTFALVKE